MDATRTESPTGWDCDTCGGWGDLTDHGTAGHGCAGGKEPCILCGAVATVRDGEYLCTAHDAECRGEA